MTDNLAEWLRKKASGLASIGGVRSVKQAEMLSVAALAVAQRDHCRKALEEIVKAGCPCVGGACACGCEHCEIVNIARKALAEKTELCDD